MRRAVLAALLLSGCGGEESPPHPAPPPAPPPTGFRFVDAGRAAGLTASTWGGGKEKAHLLDSQGNGLALLDYDGDGDLDLYLVSGWRTEPGKGLEKPGNRHYGNRGAGTADDATEAAGVRGRGSGAGVAVGGVDGDGRPDLFVTNFGPDGLFRNRGDGTFERVKDPPGIDGWSTGAVLFDADGDGDED